MELTPDQLDDTDPEVVYTLLADIEPNDWEDASAYGVDPGPPFAHQAAQPYQ